jgi:SAM-dependent methyltransferase
MIVIYIIIFLVFVSLVIASLSVAPWLPVKKKDLERINRLAALKPGQVFYELGCGDGRVCFYLAKKNPEVKIIGIEIVFPLYLWTRLKAWLSRYKNVEIKFGDALKQDLSKADVVYAFATSRSINRELKNKFEKELKKGAKVLSYIFSIKRSKGKSRTDKSNNKALPIFIYEL